MPDHQGWPELANPTIPMPPNPAQEAPHVLRDQHGTRRWAWWRPDNDRPGGAWLHAQGGGALRGWTYIGPAKTPDGLPVELVSVTRAGF
jgi:hypothetical protein